MPLCVVIGQRLALEKENEALQESVAQVSTIAREWWMPDRFSVA